MDDVCCLLFVVYCVLCECSYVLVFWPISRYFIFSEYDAIVHCMTSCVRIYFILSFNHLYYHLEEIMMKVNLLFVALLTVTICNADITITIYSGSSAWWFAVAISDPTTTSVQLEDSLSYSSWSSFEATDWGYLSSNYLIYV
jgi:hypothetical protein